MSGLPFERLGKVRHPVLSECVKVRLRSWEGPGAYDPDQEGWTQEGQYTFAEYLIPMGQKAHEIAGYCPETGRRAATISKSVSYNADLRKYAKARYPEADE